MRKPGILAGTVPLVLLSAMHLHGQTGFGSPAQRGTSPTSVYSVSNLDSIDLNSGNLSIQIPLVSLPPGPGGSGASVSLVYNSQIYDIQSTSSSGDIQLTSSTSGGGWRYTFQYSVLEEERLLDIRECPDADTQHRYRHYIVFPDGSRHPLRMDVNLTPSNDSYDLYSVEGTSLCTSLPPLSNRPVLYTDDGTYVRVITQRISGKLVWTAYFPDGRMVDGEDSNTNAMTDRNGNVISISNYSDPTSNKLSETIIADRANRRIRITYGLAVPGTAPTDTVKREYCASSSLCATNSLAWTTNQTAQVDWQSYLGTAKNYHCGQPISTPACSFTPNGTFVKTVTLPQAVVGESLQYTMTYNTEGTTNGWGELKNLLTPGGYTATFQYKFDGLNRTSVSTPVLWNPVTSKVGAYADGQGAARKENWRYVATLGGFDTSVTGPDGVVKSLQYDANGLAWKTVEPNGDFVETLWYKNLPPNIVMPPVGSGCGDCKGNPYAKAEFRNVSNGVATKLASIKVFTYDKNQNLTKTDEYDCLSSVCGTVPRLTTTGPPTGLPSLPAASRHTEASYATSTGEADAGVLAPSSDQPDAYWRATAPRLLSAQKLHEVTGPTGLTSISETRYDNERTTGNVNEALQYDSTQASAVPGTFPTSLTKDTNAIRPLAVQSATNGSDYDSYGNVLRKLDAKNTVTTFKYGADSCMNSYPTSMTTSDGSTGEALTTTAAWDCATGLLLSTTDANFVPTTRTYDAVGRLTSLKEGNPPEQRTTTIAYSDVNRTVTTTVQLDEKRNLTTTETYDPLGRLVLSKSPSDNAACTQITVDHRYLVPAATGYSYEVISNPYCDTSEATMGWTLMTRDAMGRVTQTSTYGGATVPGLWTSGYNTQANGTSTVAYSAEWTTVGDQAGKKRKNRVDGLGRLVEVVEDPDALAYSTTYEYDHRDALTKATQFRTVPGDSASTQQSRYFAYDSLGRLTSAANPESGTTAYTYDDSANVATSQVASGPVRSYSYNTRNQIVAKSYGGTNTPGVIYCYDGNVPAADGSGCATAVPSILYSNGRLTGVGSSAGMTRYTGFDSLGRVVKYEQWVDGTAYPFVYGYLLGGQQSTVKYASGREWSTEYSAAGRPISLANGGTAGACAASGCYASGVTYASHGGMAGGTFGPLVQSWSYNARMQGTGLTVTRNGTALWSMTNSFDAIANNGNISGQTVTASGAGGVNVTSTLAYDAFNRLTGVTEGGLSQTFGYDSVGNRWLESGLKLSSFTPTTSAWFEAATNRFASGVTYDDATGTGPGNTTGVGNVTLEYDAENRQKTAIVGGLRTEYWYDGDGRRVKKRTGTTGPVTVYVYGVGGELAAEYGGTAVAGDEYLVTDHLESTRLVVDGAGIVKGLHDYLPFGEEIYSGVGGRTVAYGGAADLAAQKFTGKERDSETAGSAWQGLDYFGARYMSSGQGRFTSPDPVSGTDLHVINPQRWNMYAYGLNNPLFYVDPDGRDAIAVGLSKQVPFAGHMGIISIHRDGRALYGRSGPVSGGTPAGANQVKTLPLPTVDFDSSGVPTIASYNSLAEAVGAIEQQDPASVNFAYFKTSEADTLALDSFLKVKKDAYAQGKLRWYFGLGNNCADFCINGLSSARVLSSAQAANASVIPNILFWEVSFRADSVSLGKDRKKEKVTERICNEDGSGCRPVQ